MKNFYTSICSIIENGEPLVLATIIDQAGSSPRSAGSCMAVYAGGKILGSVGGGELEAQVIDMAGKIFSSPGAVIREFDFTEPQHIPKGDPDMICGGRVAVLLEYLSADTPVVELLRKAGECQEKGSDALLVAAVDEKQLVGSFARRCLLKKNSLVDASSDFPEPLELAASLEKRGKMKPGIIDAGGMRYYVEPAVSPGTLFLFGAGHVALHAEALARHVGFDTVVVDNRDEFANPERFPDAGSVLCLETFEQAMTSVPVAHNSFIVILTHGHAHDKTVLAQALRTPAGYIGMIGSKKKRDTIYTALLQEGFSKQDLQRVHCPIGLEIDAETPEEISVSIVAELIAKRARLRS